VSGVRPGSPHGADGEPEEGDNMFQRRSGLFEVELARDLQVKQRKFAVNSTSGGPIDAFFYRKTSHEMIFSLEK
jgi:hypothetical protein